MVLSWGSTQQGPSVRDGITVSEGLEGLQVGSRCLGAPSGLRGPSKRLALRQSQAPGQGCCPVLPTVLGSGLKAFVTAAGRTKTAVVSCSGWLRRGAGPAGWAHQPVPVASSSRPSGVKSRDTGGKPLHSTTAAVGSPVLCPGPGWVPSCAPPWPPEGSCCPPRACEYGILRVTWVMDLRAGIVLGTWLCPVWSHEPEADPSLAGGRRRGRQPGVPVSSSPLITPCAQSSLEF